MSIPGVRLKTESRLYLLDLWAISESKCFLNLGNWPKPSMGALPGEIVLEEVENCTHHLQIISWLETVWALCVHLSLVLLSHLLLHLSNSWKLGRNGCEFLQVRQPANALSYLDMTRFCSFFHFPVDIRASVCTGVCTRERECAGESADRRWNERVNRQESKKPDLFHTFQSFFSTCRQCNFYWKRLARSDHSFQKHCFRQIYSAL